MIRIRTWGPVLFAAFAFSAAVVTAPASAVPSGPLFLVSGKHLKAGETRLLLATAKETFTLSSIGPTIKCTGLTLSDPNNMQIEGAHSPNTRGASKEVIEFTGCTVTGLQECSVVGKTITTAPVLNLLAYASAARGGPVLVVFEPEKGNVFVTVKFTGEGGKLCEQTSLAVTGNVIGEARKNGVGISVPGGSGDDLHGEVTFERKAAWVELNGTLKEYKTTINIGGFAAKLTGTALLLVDENGVPVHWGIFS